MEEIKSIKLQLMGEAQSFRALDGQSKICNWLYNQLLEKAQKLKQQFIETGDQKLAQIVYTERGLRDQVPKLKEELPFLKSVHSSPLKNAALRLSQSIQAHQKSRKGRRAGKKTGWPKFRSWQARWFSLLYDEPNKGFKVHGNQLKLSLGQRLSLTFTLKDSHLLNNKTIRNLRIVKDASAYYAVFTTQVLLPKTKQINRIIAFDPNHKNLIYGVDAEGQSIEVETPSWLKLYDKRIDELRSKRDRCLKKSKSITIADDQGNPLKERQIPSKRWQKYQQTLEKARHKRREQTKTFVYTLAHQICKTYDAIGIGDYAPKGGGRTTAMRRAMNNRSLIGRFKQALQWVAKKSGKICLEYDEKGTTRTCHACTYTHACSLDPSIREWECPSCQASHIRDENSAINGLRKIFQDLTEKSKTVFCKVPCSGLFQVIERWAWRVLPSRVYQALRGQDSKQLQRQEMKLGV